MSSHAFGGSSSDSGHLLTFASSSPLAGSVAAAASPAMQGTSPAATAALSSSRRLKYALSGVISEGLMSGCLLFVICSSPRTAPLLCCTVIVQEQTRLGHAHSV